MGLHEVPASVFVLSFMVDWVFRGRDRLICLLNEGSGRKKKTLQIRERKKSTRDGRTVPSVMASFSSSSDCAGKYDVGVRASR